MTILGGGAPARTSSKSTSWNRSRVGREVERETNHNLWAAAYDFQGSHCLVFVSFFNVLVIALAVLIFYLVIVSLQVALLCISFDLVSLGYVSHLKNHYKGTS